MNKLVLVDGNAIMHRAFHAMPALTTRKGEPIGAVYGFVSMLLRVIEDLKPTHIAICFDRKEPTFRHKAFKKYQSHRPETHEELSPQFAKARKVAEAMGIPTYDKKGFEADDIIGTLATIAARVPKSKSQIPNSKKYKTLNIKYRAQVESVVIVTGDKDILQLVTDKIQVYLPKRGIVNAELHGPEEVVLKMGVTPKQIIDYKALVGDSSDNYPGVYGIGPKTAEQLLEKYETFDEIYKHLDEISETVAKKLKKSKKEGELSYKLAKIITDVPFKYNLNEMSKWSVGNDDTLKLFQEYGFRTLSGRVKEVGKEIEKEKQDSLFQ